MVEDELNDTQRGASDESNTNMTTGITGVYTQLYEVPLVDIDEDISG